MADVPNWQVVGDWFEVCKCAVPCPCTFAQPPTEGDCEGVLIWHINEGNFGDADDLAGWRAAVAGKFEAAADALEGPTSVAGKRTQVYDPPGSEVGPGSVATYGTATAGSVDALGLSWNWTGRSSKHMAFEWSGPDSA